MENNLVNCLAGRKFSMKNAAAKWRASGLAAKKAKKSNRKTRSKGAKRARPYGSGFGRMSL